MRRLTQKTGLGAYTAEENSVYHAENGWGGEAVNRLGQLEDLWETLEMQQEEIAKKLEELRAQGKTKSVQFRELLSAKLMNSHALALILAHGLK